LFLSFIPSKFAAITSPTSRGIALLGSGQQLACYTFHASVNRCAKQIETSKAASIQSHVICGQSIFMAIGSSKTSLVHQQPTTYEVNTEHSPTISVWSRPSDSYIMVSMTRFVDLRDTAEVDGLLP
jgi:hypothetical protein